LDIIGETYKTVTVNIAAITRKKGINIALSDGMENFLNGILTRNPIDPGIVVAIYIGLLWFGLLSSGQ
jgi:hypothetical protein